MVPRQTDVSDIDASSDSPIFFSVHEKSWGGLIPGKDYLNANIS